MPLKNPIFKHITSVVDSMGLEAYVVGCFKLYSCGIHHWVTSKKFFFQNVFFY